MFPISICSGAFDSSLELPISPCRSRSLRRAEVWNSKPEFSVAKVWPPSVTRFLQYRGKGCKCPMRWGHLERKGVPIANWHSQVLRAFRGSKRETQKLSGNRETKTFMGHPDYSCGLMLQKTAPEMGCEADGREPLGEMAVAPAHPALAASRTAGYFAGITSLNFLNHPLKWVLLSSFSR